jgi:hypothetical protein
MASLLSTAFIDAGLMTAWHDSFAITNRQYRVLRIQHDAAKTYGSSFYSFITDGFGNIGVTLSSGWNPSGTPPINVPTGTQFLDYHRLPVDTSASGSSSTRLAAMSTTSNLFLDRYTSATDTKQSWFVFRQPGARSAPFSVLHKDTALHTWLDLNKGIVNGVSTIAADVSSRMGYARFQLQENIRRCLLTGSALRGRTNTTGDGTFHTLNFNTHLYVGVGTSATDTNIGGFISGNSAGSAFPLPVAKAVANPAYLTDYNPVCTDLAWSVWTPTKLALDFGVYMHYNDNDTAYQDRFIVQSGVNEWEALQFANNSVVVDGASPTFVARVV